MARLTFTTALAVPHTLCPLRVQGWGEVMVYACGIVRLNACQMRMTEKFMDYARQNPSRQAESSNAFAALRDLPLAEKMWIFGAVGGAQYANCLKLLPNHRMSGYYHENEVRWDIAADCLTLSNKYGEPTTIFDECEMGPDGLFSLTGRLVFNPGSNARHYLREIREPYAIAPNGDNFVIDRHFTGKRRRNLVLMGANQNSLHTQWARNIADENRNWDLAISFYGAAEHYPPVGPVEYSSLQTGVQKFPAIHAAMYEGSPFWDYERIMLFDDDIMTNWRDLNRFFEICREYDLQLAQPALDPASYVFHGITAQQPDYLLRFTSFVEIMCPCFTRAALRICAPCMQSGIYGHGVDLVWPRLLGEPRNSIAIVDAVAVEHTRPTGANYPFAKAKEEEEQLMQTYKIGWPYYKLHEYGRIER